MPSTTDKPVERTIGGLHEFLAANLPALPLQAKMLDVGCGSGAWLQRIQNLGYKNICGIDHDTEQFKLAPSLVSKVDLAWEEFPFPDATFDFISVIEVIEHIENTGLFLSQIRRVLKPEGIILLTTPNTQSMIARARFLLTGKLKSFDDIGDPTHISPIFRHAFSKILQSQSLQVQRSFCFPENDYSPTSRPATRLLGKLLRIFLPNPYPGDTCCLFLTKTATLAEQSQ